MSETNGAGGAGGAGGTGGNGASTRTGSVLVALFFVVAGVVTLYDTTTYTDIDSKVFPRAAAILLIVAASIALAGDIVRGTRETGFGQGDWWRRILLIVAMLACCLAMPITGFLPAAGIAFDGALIAALHERWTARRAVIYGGSAVVLMGGFYALFRYALHVPLP